MKTLTRMIGRYVLATAAVVLLVVGLLLGAVVYLGLHYGEAADSRVRIGTLAEALIPTADGLQLDPARTPADWLQGYAWAMVLDDDGSVIWQHDLPQNLNKHYTASEIASFSRWYLDDWPVFCWTADYGLFVAAMPRGSVWRCNIYNNAQLMNAMAAGMLPALALLLGVPAACCLLFSWRGARRLQTIAAGLATVADGGTIRLPTDGFAGELADTVNRTSEQLRRRNEIIARRDDARTSWIAGVSHDVRTPLALILGWAEQLEQDTALPAAARQKACGIRTQSEKLRALIEDLNLTSKLQYGAQPLRCQPTQAGPLLRRLAAEFCDSPLAASCTVALEIAPDADKAILNADAALLARAVENLLHNAACHNPGPVQVQLSAVRTGKTLRITIADDGAGYPPAVLHALQTGEAGENTPHILGLHVVEQIIRPTGLLDPKVEVRPVEGQIDDLIGEVNKEVGKGNKILITTLTKRMAEDLTDYMREVGIRVKYLHSDIDTLERTEIIRDMRLDVFDVLVGINLLREGLDIPEITLVAILDADKEGFLRSETSLIQTIGRAARNSEGHVIMYADTMTESMQLAIDETQRRREIQMQYNKEHGITPKTIQKSVRDLISISKKVAAQELKMEKDPESMSRKELEKLVRDLEKQMKKAAAELNFEVAAELRDKLIDLKKMLNDMDK